MNKKIVCESCKKPIVTTAFIKGSKYYCCYKCYKEKDNGKGH